MASPDLQPSLTDMGQPLREATFCVVDLETTGTGKESAITEIGAVKVRAGETVGEFRTFVNPELPIPAVITTLTGITNAMVADAPTIDTVMPSFLEFATGAVVVAHNANFDVGFLKRACEEWGFDWPDPTVLDTVPLARQAIPRTEVRNYKLSTLSQYVHVTTSPTHRALDDAKATVDVLHYIIARVGNRGIFTVEDLVDLQRFVPRQRREKKTLANDIPQAPGVYQFIAERPGADPQVLYVGKSINLRSRVRNYFTANEQRRWIDEMVRIATRIETTVCATDLEAEVRELRMIAAHKPRYNRRSRRQDKVSWVKLTDEAWPRLSIVRKVAADNATYWGPFRRRSTADLAIEAIYDAYPLRQCAARLSTKRRRPSCALAELGRCAAPCLGQADPAEYAAMVEDIRRAMTVEIEPTLAKLGPRIWSLSRQERYEEAAVLTDRAREYASATMRRARITHLARCPQIVAAIWVAPPKRNAGWHIHVVRFGRLAGAALAAPGMAPLEVADNAVELAETVTPMPHDLPAASIEETERIAAWLERPGVRLIDVDGEWSWPLHAGFSPDALPRLLAAGPLTGVPAEPGAQPVGWTHD